MNFGQAFTFAFEDPDWAKKIIIPALIGLIPLIGQIFLIGWGLNVTRAVIRQDSRPLPDLDFGKQLGDGFKAFVVGLVYAIPAILLSIPIVIVSLITSDGSMNEDTVTALVSIVSICCNGLIFLYALVMAFVLPAAYGNMIVNDSIGAGLRFSEVFGLVRAAPGAYLLSLLGGFLASLIAQLGIIACGIGVVLTMAYAMVINGHLYGQAYAESTRNRSAARIY